MGRADWILIVFMVAVLVLTAYYIGYSEGELSTNTVGFVVRDAHDDCLIAGSYAEIGLYGSYTEYSADKKITIYRRK